MKSFKKYINDEKGNALLIAMIALVVLTFIGIMAVNNTSTELQIAGNDRLAKLSFFTAEASRGYVVGHPTLYSFAVMTDPDGMDFPDEMYIQSDGSDEIDTAITNGEVVEVDGEKYLCLDYPSCKQKARGNVSYDTSGKTKKTPPPGSGFSYGEYSAYVYIMTAEGRFDPLEDGHTRSCKQIEQGFFRIGL